MAFVISIQGGRAVGKTTLIENMKRARPEYVYSSPGPIELGRLQENVEEEFYQIQGLFIEREAQRFSQLVEADIAVLDRGPEEREFFILFYPRIHQKNWDVEGKFSKQLSKLRAYRSNRILYLDASLDMLLARYVQDNRERSTMNVWLQDWHPYVKAFFKAHPKAKVLDTDNMLPDEVLSWTLSWIDQGCPFW
jgi:deoxyadenosine/deoxycytidine kinase